MNFLIILAGFFNLLLGGIVYSRAKNQVQKKFSYLVFLIAFWVFVNYIYYQFPCYPYVNLTYAIGAPLVAYIFFWVCFYTRRKLSLLSKVGLVLFSIVGFVGSLVPDLVISKEVTITNFGVEIAEAPFFLLYAIPASFILLAAIVLLYRMRNRSLGLVRVQANYVLLGFSVPVLIIIFFDFAVPLHKVLWLGKFDSLTSIIFAAFISYAITRYRFFDIQLVLKRGLVRIFSFAIILGSYIYPILIIRRQGLRLANLSEEALIIFSIILVGITAEPLRRLTNKSVDRLFASRENRREDSLRRLELISKSTLHFQTLVEKVTTELSKILEVRTQFLLRSSETGALEQYPEKILSLSPSDPLVTYLEKGRVLIAQELPFRMDEGEISLQPILETMQVNSFSLAVPLGSGDEMFGAIVFLDEKGAAAFTSDKIDFIKRFGQRATLAFAGALAYKQALERIVRNA